MARDLLALAAALGGSLHPGPAPGAPGPATLVDGALHWRDFTLIGHPTYATVVAADRLDLAASSLDGSDRRLPFLPHAVLALPDSELAREWLPSAPGTVLLAPVSTGELLHARLTAVLAQDQAAEDRAVTLGTKVLTQVARRGGAAAIVNELASRVDGWAVLLDTHGQTIATSGAGSLHVADAAAVAFNRPVRVRHPGLQVHPVGLGEDLTAYLVFSSRSGRESTHRDLAAQAAALLDLVLRRQDHSATERLGREVMMSTVLAGGAEAAALLRRWGVREERLVGFELSSRSQAVDVERLVRRWFDALGAPHLFTMGQDAAKGLIAEERLAGLEARAEEFGTPPRPALRLGVGSARPVDALGPSAVEAREAHQSAVDAAVTVRRYHRMPSVEYVMDRLPATDGARLASLLDPLALRPDGEELLRTLRAYLVANGAWSAASRTLGVHRQTLMNRVASIEELTGWDLGDIDARTGAWLALRARGISGS
ncbi:PucR family transcriptional regulator [Galactobacter valiniphilus]|uniref:PucR family transcriptional regulator n=1 Tax=Galactobacter valiniphilus TaxID=2676122 RepID=UPI003734F71E